MSTASSPVAASHPTASAGSPGFFLPVRVLSRLFRRLFLEQLTAAYQSHRLHFFGQQQNLMNAQTFDDTIRPLRNIDWVVYAKPPFAGPKAVLAYLSRYTHRVAISNSRLISQNQHRVTFKYKDYRAKQRYRVKSMTLETDEFIRRFLIHVLPTGFHRIRHYGIFANTGRVLNLAQARQLLSAPDPSPDPATVNDNLPSDQTHPTFLCPECGASMSIVGILEQEYAPRAPPRS